VVGFHDAASVGFVPIDGGRAMYFAPIHVPDGAPVKPGDHMGAIGGPDPNSAAALKRDAADAARDYPQVGKIGPALNGRSQGCSPHRVPVNEPLRQQDEWTPLSIFGGEAGTAVMDCEPCSRPRRLPQRLLG
jgi:hypothetical protein